MSDDREPRPPRDERDPAAPPPPDRPESPAEQVRELVEEIQHEIEEVIEHVPQPVRWTVRRIIMIALLALVAFVVVAVVSVILWLANRTEWVAQEVTVVLNQTLARRSNVTLQMDDLRGNPFTGIRVIRPRLRFRDGRGEPVFEAKSLSLRYGAWSLATGGSRPVIVELESPIIRIERKPDGTWRLPTWESRPSRVRGRGGPARRFEVTIRDARVDLPAPYGGITDLELAARVHTGAVTEVGIESLTWAGGPWGSRLTRFEGAVVAGDSVRVRIGRLETPDLALAADARWAAGQPEHRVHLEVDRVRWAWLARVFDNGALDVPGEGRVTADLSDRGGWHGAFAADVSWNGLDARGTGRVEERRPGGWTVDRIDMTSKAGRFQGRFLYDRTQWSVAGRVEDGDPAHWAALRIPGWPEGDLAGRFVYSVDTRRRASRLDARLEGSTLAGWRADSAHVAVDFPAPGSAAFDVRMLRRGGVMVLDAATDAGGWSGRWEAEDFPLDEWPDGRRSGIRGTLTRGAGTVANRADGLHVTGALEGRSSEWLGARMDGWRLDGVAGRLLPVPDLAAVARLSDVMFLGLHWDSATVAFELGDQAAHLAAVTAVAADTVVTVAGDVTWEEGSWNARFDRAAMRSRSFAWTADPPVVLAGDPRGVTFERLSARDGDAALEIEGRWAGPGGSYDWTGRAAGLDLARLGLPDSLGLGGRADVTLRVTGASGDPRFTLVAATTRPAILGHAGDTLSLALAGRPHALEVERLGFGVDGGTLEARGTMTGMERAWPDSLTPPRVLDWIATAERWRLEADARALPIEGAGRLHPGFAGWTGDLSGSVEVGGSPRRPEFAAHLTAAPFSYGSYVMDRTRLMARYRERTLEVQEFEMTAGTVTSRITGQMPLQLALDRRPEIPERGMLWEVRIPQGDLAVLPAFVPQIGAAAGRFEMQARIAGTPARPELDGTFRIRDGTVRLAAREEILEKVNADFRLDETRITLDTLTAIQGERGRIAGRGVVDLDGLALRRYDFDLDLDRFTASEAGVYAAEVDGDLRVVNGPRVRGVTLPQVTGQVGVHRAVVLYDFTRQTESDLLAASVRPLFWTYRIELDAADNLRWTPADADIEFSADLTLEQTRDSLLIYGEMQAIRGTYYFLSTRFEVERAVLTFDNVNGVNPVIDAEATTTVIGGCEGADPAALSLGSGGADAVEPSYTIRVGITGRAEEPEVAFASEPAGLDESCILRQITLDDGNFAGTEVTNSFLARAISRTVSPELERAFRGYLNDWRVERQAGAYVVGVSTQPVRNVNLRFRQRLPIAETQNYSRLEDPFEQSVQAEYRLGRFFYIATQLVRRATTPTSPPNANTRDFNVNLKARWEY